MWSNTQAVRTSTTQNKLAQLRAKTNRDLAALVQSLVERSFNALRRDEYAEANAEYTEAAKLLPVMQDVSAPDSTALRTRLAELRAELDNATCPCSH